MLKITIILPAILLLCSSLAAQVYGNCERSNYLQRGGAGSKRSLVGGDLQAAEHQLRMMLVRLTEGDDGPFYRVAEIFDASEQLVAGSLRTLYAELIDFNGMHHNCQVDIWARLWLAEDDTEITIRCECMNTVVRHVAASFKF